MGMSRLSIFVVLLGLGNYPGSVFSAELPKCMDVANRFLRLGGFEAIRDSIPTATEKVIVGAALELTRERYRTNPEGRPDFRWLESESKSPNAEAAYLRMLKHEGEKINQRATVLTTGESPRERVTQILIQGKRNGSTGYASTDVHFDEKCRITRFVTDPQDLGQSTRELNLSAKSCLPVFKVASKGKMPPLNTKFSRVDVEKRLPEFKKILPAISYDDPTMAEALENSQDLTYLTVTNQLYWSKLNLCREFVESFADPNGLLAGYKRTIMIDRRETGSGGSPDSKKSVNTQ